MNRAEHLAWAKTRALEYVDLDKLPIALASFISDLGKHHETADLAGRHAIPGTKLLLGPPLATADQVRAWIEAIT